MSEINGVNIPDPSVITENIPDPIGGYLYKVTTVVTVDQIRLDTVEQKLAEAQADLIKAQERVASEQAIVDAVKAVK